MTEEQKVVTEEVPVKITTPSPEPVKVETPNPVDNTQELLGKVLKEIEQEDSKRTEVMEAKFKTQVEEMKKSFQDSYDSKFNELHKKLEEVSGRKGIVESQSANPLNTPNPVIQPTEKVDLSKVKLDRKTDYELAQNFISNIKK